MGKDTFTANGIYYDGTSIDFIAPQPFNFDRAARELQDVSMDVAMDGVTDVFGTGTDSQGSNMGRAKVSSPSMTFTVEAWDALIQSPAFKQKGLAKVLFDFTLLLKAKEDSPQIRIECKGCRFLGFGLQSWSNSSNLLLIKVPMFVRKALWNGVSLTGSSS
jgi:hypothetical protein